VIDHDEDGWTHNLLELPEGFAQRYSADPETTTVNCDIASSRSDTAPGHGYKIGDTIKIRSGYKIRASKEAKESLFAKDDVVQEFTLLETAGAAALTLMGSALLALTTL